MKNVLKVLLITLSFTFNSGCTGLQPEAKERSDSEALQEADENSKNGQVEAAVSSRYELVEDRNKDTCEVNKSLCVASINLCTDFEKSLNQFPGETPMVFENNRLAETGFTVPSWQAIKSEDIDWELLRQRSYLRGSVVAKASAEGLLKLSERDRKVYEDRSKQQTILWYAEFDLDNDGDIERVYRLANYEWDKEVEPYKLKAGPSMFVVNEENEIDPRYKSIASSSGDVFFYKGRTLLSKWERIVSKGNYININNSFMPRNMYGTSIRPLCKLKYILH